MDESHSSQDIRSFARSQTISENTEKLAGAGEEPKGSLVSKAPISCPSLLGHVAMHLAEIRGCVCSRRYAFSMSILLHRIGLLGWLALMPWMR